MVADAFEEAAFLVGEGGHALALHFVEQLVHAAVLGLAPLLLALHAPLGAFLLPALPEVGPLPLGGRLVALQAGVALGEVVAEQRLLAAGLQVNQLLPARDVDEQG